MCRIIIGWLCSSTFYKQACEHSVKIHVHRTFIRLTFIFRTRFPCRVNPTRINVQSFAASPLDYNWEVAEKSSLSNLWVYFQFLTSQLTPETGPTTQFCFDGLFSIVFKVLSPNIAPGLSRRFDLFLKKSQTRVSGAALLLPRLQNSPAQLPKSVSCPTVLRLLFANCWKFSSRRCPLSYPNLRYWPRDSMGSSHSDQYWQTSSWLIHHSMAWRRKCSRIYLFKFICRLWFESPTAPAS